MARRFSDEWIERLQQGLAKLLSRENADIRLPASDLFGLCVAIEEARAEVRRLADRLEEATDAILRHELADAVDRVLDREERARAPTLARPLRRPGPAGRRVQPEEELPVPEWTPGD